MRTGQTGTRPVTVFPLKYQMAVQMFRAGSRDGAAYVISPVFVQLGEVFDVDLRHSIAPCNRVRIRFQAFWFRRAP
jgi:hypothetical protein